MGGGPRPGEAQRVLVVALVALCFLLARPQPTAAFFFGVRSGAVGSFDRIAITAVSLFFFMSFPVMSSRVPFQRSSSGGREEKVPMTVVVADYSPRPAPFGPSPSAAPTPAPAPAPMPGSDGGDEDGTPRLPSERRSSGAPSSGDHHSAGAPAGATSADFISSSPAVPLPAGVTDSATVLPMPTPGQQQQLRVPNRSPFLSSLIALHSHPFPPLFLHYTVF
jgi:hypothetical protein